MNLIEMETPVLDVSAFGERTLLDVPMDDITRKICAIVAQIAERHDVIHAIGPADHLVDSGMTSMAMVDLMLAIEADFDVMIPQREMTPLNFQSIDTLAQMLRRIIGGA